MMFNPGQSWLKPRKPPQMGIASGAGSSAPGALAGPRPQGLASNGPRYGLSGFNMGGNVAGPSGGTGLHNLSPQAPAPSQPVTPVGQADPREAMKSELGGLEQNMATYYGTPAWQGYKDRADTLNRSLGNNIGGEAAAGLAAVKPAAISPPPGDGHSVPYNDPYDVNRTYVSGVMGRVKSMTEEQNPYLTNDGMLSGLERKLGGLADQGAINASHARHAALLDTLRGGGLRSQKDMANLSDNQYAMARNNQDSLVYDYAGKATDWERQHNLDVLAANGLLSPAATSIYDIQDRNRDTYAADQTALDRINAIREGYRQPGLDNALAPQRQAQAEAEVAAAVSRGQITAEDARQAKWMADNQGWVAAANFIAGITGGAVKIATMGAL